MNNKTLKAGILISILVVPALVFIFLKIFGSNKFDLPHYFPVTDDRGEIVMNGNDTTFHTIPDFKLLNYIGDSVSNLDLKDKIYVVNFFFSRCGTICPITIKNIKHSQELFNKEPNLNFLSISVDPVYDTPKVLSDYAKRNDVNAKKWFFCTGDKSYIYNLILKGYKLPVADASEYDASIKDIDEMFIHSEKLLLIDTNSQVRGIYDGTKKEEIEKLNLEIKVLLDSFK